MIRASLHRLFLILFALGLAACEKASETAAEPAVDVVAELTALYHEFDEEMLALDALLDELDLSLNPS